MKKRFCFTVDDNIRFFKELTNENKNTLFDHPYLQVFQRLHEALGMKVQLNLFYEDKEFNLSMMTDKYRDEWQENADWLKLSFHSRLENVSPYASSGFDEVNADCSTVHREILRFAGKDSLATSTTLHFCLATSEGIEAMKQNGVTALLGLFGTSQSPRTSYTLSLADAEQVRQGNALTMDGMTYRGIDIVLNLFDIPAIEEQLNALIQEGREQINVMIHEQYFYSDYRYYQPDFEEKLAKTFSILTTNGYQSAFFEDL